MNIIAIVGSPRIKGNTNYLVDQALAEAKKLGIEAEKVVLTHYRVAPCLGHDDCGSIPMCQIKDDFNKLLEKFRTANGVIVASPVYSWNVSAQLKTFIDRTRLLKHINAKIEARCAGIIAIAGSSGLEETLAILKRYIQSRGNIPPERIFTLGGFARNLGEAKSNAALTEEARRLGRQMAENLMASQS